VEVEASGEFADARKAFAGGQFAAKNSKSDLGDYLLAEGDFARVLEPEAHACKHNG